MGRFWEDLLPDAGKSVFSILKFFLMKTDPSLKELMKIPGVGKSIAADLQQIDIYGIGDLKGKDPEMMYEQSNRVAGMVQDRCLLYVFRCAVYFAEAGEDERDPEKLKWWNWKDK
jgi:hypothetical protein